MGYGTSDDRLVRVISLVPDRDLQIALYKSYVGDNNLCIPKDAIFLPEKSTGTILDELIRSHGVLSQPEDSQKVVPWHDVLGALNLPEPKLMPVSPLTYDGLGEIICKAQNASASQKPSRQRISAWITQGVKPDKMLRSALWYIFNVLPEHQAIYDLARHGPSRHKVALRLR